MNALIKIGSNQFNGQNIQTVDARELHAFLEVGKDFSTWIKGRIEQYGFVEHHDFVTAQNLRSPVLGSTKARAQVAIDYYLSLDMAKELAMVERNAKGKQARLYFIECEKQAKDAVDPAKLLGDPVALRAALLGYTEKVMVLEQKIEEQAPKVLALERISASSDAMTVTEAAKVLGVKRQYLTNFMHANGWVYRQNSSWVAYDKHIKNGDLQYKEATYTDDKTGQECIKPYCHITQKGLAKLAQQLQSAA